MYDIDKIINEELEYIEYMVRRLEAQAHDFEGSMYVKKSTKGDQYFLRERHNNDKDRSSYKLGDDRSAKVIEIKQAKYNMALLKKLEKNRALLEKMRGSFERYDIESVDEALSFTYRDYTGLVNKDPVFMNREEWAAAPYKGNDIPISEDGNKAMDGRKVRSKSEVIIYDILKYFGVPFRYDADINLRNELGERVYKNADFVIWSLESEYLNNAGPIILEHFGRLDDARYFENAMQKMRLYLRNGYRLWDNLFISADSEKGTVNANAIYRMIKDMIIPKVMPLER